MDVFLFSALKPCEEQVADLYLSGLRASVAKNDVEFVIRAHIPVKGQLGCQGFQISLDRFGGRACRPGGTIERSEARRVGTEGVRSCISRWSPYTKKPKQTKYDTTNKIN